MSFEIMHFRGADKILKSKKMEREVKLTMEYLNDCLFGTFHKRELLRQALEEMDWRPKEDLNILDGRRYSYKGFRKRVAMDGSFASYEYIQDALLRLQIGFDKNKIDMGIVLVTAQRSEKSPLGNTRTLVNQEIDMLYPTISLPVTIVLFSLGKPGAYLEEEDKQTDNGTVDDGNNDEILSRDTISDEGTIPSKKKRTRKRRHQPVNNLTHEPVGPPQAA
ncbi:MAG: hypothetical protein ACLQBC_10785 [Syntrophales bacterium]